ncbi:Hypothetical predicted protein [Pelobates cultripes]|uniref:Uncharacterized protein n=1 Tax=Pelobates cultripes TaxID=61616 RepID=A0AAD1SPH3_PELCU|nr:Hypothetical predicted protein [Pelobates cultripes]
MGTSSDVIVHFQNRSDRQALMSAVHHKSPYHFEEHALNFYQDLSRATMVWLRSMRPLTAELIKHRIPYKWGSPRSLLVPHDTGTLKITDASEAAGTLRILGLSTHTREQQQPGAPPQHTAWDPARVHLFMSAATKLSENSIKYNGLRHLAQHLCTCTLIEAIDLSSNSIDNAGVETLSGVLSKFKNLKKIM